MWRYTNKNIYFMDVMTTSEILTRINELGGIVVKLPSKLSVDVVCYKNESKLNELSKALEKQRKSQEKDGHPMKFISIQDFQRSMGYDETLPFALWSEMPDYNPWGGERIYPKRYNDDFIQELDS